MEDRPAGLDLSQIAPKAQDPPPRRQFGTFKGQIETGLDLLEPLPGQGLRARQRESYAKPL
jgi:hypothetical protein